MFDSYSASKYGKYHALQPLRYARYDYERAKKLTDLGDDVHPLLHMPYTYSQIVNPLLREQVSAKVASELSPENIKAIRLAALVHDIGECEYPELEQTCGDIHKSDRTAVHEAIEQSVRGLVYKEVFSFVPDEYLERAEDIIMKNDPSDFATQTFEVAEELGYYATGIRAGEVLIQENTTDFTVQRTRQLAKLALKVPLSWIDRLEKASAIYPYIQNELLTTRETYSTVQHNYTI